MMIMIRKFGLLAAGIALMLVGLATSLVISPAMAQVRTDGIDVAPGPSSSVTPVPGWGGMMGGNNGMMGSRSTGTTANTMMGTAGTGGMMGDVDRHFIEQMIPHHQAAIDMADLALQKSQRPEIRTLAANIKSVQQSEISQMRSWYQQWYGTEVPVLTSTQSGYAGGMMGGGMMGGNNGMMGGCSGMGGDVTDLKNAADFDKAFIEAMIPHHQMALMMSNMVLVAGDKAELHTLVQAIITSQSAQIDQMRTWYQQWYSNGNGTK
ncbi:MAG: DUF305 domain-containing protein [Chloroflexota bacterium]